MLELVSPDGDQGFPGEVVLRARYAVTDDVLALDLEARTDAPTVVGPASHVYLNLAGEGSGTVDDHTLTVEADRYLPVGRDGVPLDGLAAVRGHAAGPHRPRPARGPGAGGAPADRGRGRDRPLLPPARHRAARRRPAGAPGRAGGPWKLWTDQPALQVYTGNALDGTITGTGGRAYPRGAGIALEPQHHPDSPNRPELSDPVLRPGQTYRSRTEWRFRY